MKVVGVFLLVLGLIGLLLNLIFWLPAGFNPVVAVPISVVCLAAVWGGGWLSQPRTGLMTQSSGQYQPIPSQTRWSQMTGANCPKCNSEITPGQQFCGSCGSSLVSYCARCGNAISEPSRFCGRCGTRLS